MKRYLKILLLAVFFSFGWGIWWGFYKLELQNPKIKTGPEVQILALRGFFTKDFLKSFEEKYHIHLVITEKTTENDLLRTALSQNSDFDLIQITSYLTQSFLIENVFQPLDHSLVSRFNDISVDFKSLDYDPSNKLLVPLSWGISGFVIHSKKISPEMTDLNDLFTPSLKTSVLNSPIELYNLAVKFKPIIKTWVETGQKQSLSSTLHELKTVFKVFSNNPTEEILSGSLDAGQISNGEAAELIKKNPEFKFILPKERAPLWISMIGLSHRTQNVDRAQTVLNLLLKPDINTELIKSNKQATVLTTLNSSNLPALQKASYIREVPLAKVELYVNHEAFEHTWTDALDDELLHTAAQSKAQIKPQPGIHVKTKVQK
ncbi:MAG: extracellular solute-binding protein [Bdellovibrionales bacterium]